MKYKKCPRCELNYILQEEDICKVCKDEINNVKSIFDCDENVCPFCGVNVIGNDETMCKECRLRER